MSSTSTASSSPLKPTHLILVCCHAIYISPTTSTLNPTTNPTTTTPLGTWLLQAFQKDEIPTFTAHIKTGLSLLQSSLSSPSSSSSSSSPALLIFSGSSTRSETRTSEAQSYLDLCSSNDFFSFSPQLKLKEKILLEEKALDSFGNLVFSVIRFWKETGAWPERITIVSHEFKRERFLELHLRAMRFPRERVRFVGVDPEYMVEGSEGFDRERAEDVRRGERVRGWEEWRRDGFGKGEVLRGKRKGRNVWGVGGGCLFDDQEERERSGVRSVVLEGEEVLIDERQPWEGDLEDER